MTRLSVAVMAHQRRSVFVRELINDLGIDRDRVVWDSINDRWDTGRRAMLHHDPDSDWHMVLQDDALVCRDLVAGLEVALDNVPRETIVSPFMGTRRPAKQRMEEITSRARREDPSWIVMNVLNWGVGIIVPTASIPGMVAWCDSEDYPNYDKRVGRYYWRVLHWTTWHPWPNLIDHRRGPSLAGHGDSVAYEFIGADRSALDRDWGGSVMDTRGAGRTRPQPVGRVSAPLRRRPQPIVSRKGPFG